MKVVVSWPVVVVVIAVLFHSEIAKLLDRLGTLSVGSAKVELITTKAQATVATDRTSETPAQAPEDVKVATQTLVNLQQALPPGSQAGIPSHCWSFVGEYTESKDGVSKGKWDRRTLQFSPDANPDRLSGQIFTVIDDVYVRRTPPSEQDYRLGPIVGVHPVGTRVAVGEIKKVPVQQRQKVWATVRPLFGSQTTEP